MRTNESTNTRIKSRCSASRSSFINNYHSTDKALHLIPRDLSAFIVIDVSIVTLATTICSACFFPTRWNPTNDVDCKRIIPFVWESLSLEIRYITDVYVWLIVDESYTLMRTCTDFIVLHTPNWNLHWLLDNLMHAQFLYIYIKSFKKIWFFRICSCIWKNIRLFLKLKWKF